MHISTRRLYWEYYICMNACIYECIMYVCVFVLQSARHSARRSLIGALIGALCAVDVSQVKYARIENVCIYVTFGVCMHSLAGLLIVVLVWVLFTSVTYVVIATHAG